MELLFQSWPASSSPPKVVTYNIVCTNIVTAEAYFPSFSLTYSFAHFISFPVDLLHISASIKGNNNNNNNNNRLTYSMAQELLRSYDRPLILFKLHLFSTRGRVIIIIIIIIIYFMAQELLSYDRPLIQF